MPSVHIVYFVVALFLALAVLIQWKRRRDLMSARVSRGLRGYVDTKRVVRVEEPGKPGERLIPA